MASARRHLSAKPDQFLSAMVSDAESFATPAGFDDDVCIVIAEVRDLP